MAGHAHKLEILRGLIKFKSNTQKIWGVLILLSIVTAVEVALGIYKPEALMVKFLSMKLLNWIFIILTIVKAYYITWDFMHMRDETKALQAVHGNPVETALPGTGSNKSVLRVTSLSSNLERARANFMQAMPPRDNPTATTCTPRLGVVAAVIFWTMSTTTWTC